MSNLFVSKKNESFIQVTCDESVAQELSDYFAFFVPGHEFQPLFKAGRWDGKIRLFDRRYYTLHFGLAEHLQKFAADRQYSLQFDDAVLLTSNFSIAEAQVFADSLKLPVEPHDYQIEAFAKAIRNRRILIVSPTACHAEGTPILKYDGTLCAAESLRVGDLLMGPDNTPRKILTLYTGMDTLYRMDVARNAHTTVNSQHVLVLEETQTKKRKYCTVEQYLSRSKNFKHRHYIRTNDRPFFFGAAPYSGVLSAYFVGLYLGDGHCDDCAVTTMDPEIVDELQTISQQMNMSIRVSYNGSKASTYHLVGHKGKRNKIFLELEKDGLCFGAGKKKITRCHTKHIPQSLKTGTVEQRLALLAGLIDTDGSLCLGDTDNAVSYEFYTHSPLLREDVAFVARSLGFAATVRSKIINKKEYFTVRIMGNDIGTIPVRVQRKKVRNWSPDVKDKHNHAFTLTDVGIGKYYGFELAGDHLYFTDDFILHHNSGKSLIMYLIVRYLHMNHIKGIIIVGTTSLVEQLFGDFRDYGWDVDKFVHRMYAGKEKKADHFLTVSTWQSLKNFDPTYLKQFDFVIGDEAHQHKAKELSTILANLSNADVRVGTTGTLDGTKTNRLVLEGHFGPVFAPVTTKELMDSGRLAQLQIKCLILKYPTVVCQSLRKSTYQEEYNAVVSYLPRAKFVRNLALSLTGNTLVLFQLVMKHGQPMYEGIRDGATKGRPVFFVHGGVETMDREEVRRITEESSNAIIVASYGTFSTGINIKNLHNVIFAAPSKSRIRNLQSIGRGLRKAEGKTHVTLFDIVDDLRIKKHTNFLLHHFKHRAELYHSEKFTFLQYLIDLK